MAIEDVTAGTGGSGHQKKKAKTVNALDTPSLPPTDVSSSPPSSSSSFDKLEVQTVRLLSRISGTKGYHQIKQTFGTPNIAITATAMI